jgi:hypothetical protein
MLLQKVSEIALPRLVILKHLIRSQPAPTPYAGGQLVIGCAENELIEHGASFSDF